MVLPSTIILSLGLSATSALSLWIPNEHRNAVLVPRGSCCSKGKANELPPSSASSELPTSSELQPSPPPEPPVPINSPQSVTAYNSVRSTPSHTSYFSGSSTHSGAEITRSRSEPLTLPRSPGWHTAHSPGLDAPSHHSGASGLSSYGYSDSGPSSDPSPFRRAGSPSHSETSGHSNPSHLPPLGDPASSGASEHHAHSESGASRHSDSEYSYDSRTSPATLYRSQLRWLKQAQGRTEGCSPAHCETSMGQVFGGVAPVGNTPDIRHPRRAHSAPSSPQRTERVCAGSLSDGAWCSYHWCKLGRA